jgi:multisubunit Na+/H+ antiporter MnhB subunit
MTYIVTSVVAAITAVSIIISISRPGKRVYRQERKRFMLWYSIIGLASLFILYNAITKSENRTVNIVLLIGIAGCAVYDYVTYRKSNSVE